MAGFIIVSSFQLHKLWFEECMDELISLPRKVPSLQELIFMRLSTSDIKFYKYLMGYDDYSSYISDDNTINSDDTPPQPTHYSQCSEISVNNIPPRPRSV